MDCKTKKGVAPLGRLMRWRLVQHHSVVPDATSGQVEGVGVLLGEAVGGVLGHPAVLVRPAEGVPLFVSFVRVGDDVLERHKQL